MLLDAPRCIQHPTSDLTKPNPFLSQPHRAIEQPEALSLTGSSIPFTKHSSGFFCSYQLNLALVVSPSLHSKFCVEFHRLKGPNLNLKKVFLKHSVEYSCLASHYASVSYEIIEHSLAQPVSILLLTKAINSLVVQCLVCEQFPVLNCSLNKPNLVS